jgi:hypothetical protein
MDDEMGSPLSTRNQAEKHAMEAPITSCCKEIQAATTGTNFWDSQEPILETYLECATTATSATYFDVVQRVPKPAIQSKRRGKMSRGCIVAQQCLSLPVCWKPSGN